MAEDVVILLSSDDSDAFVTPHPRAASEVDDGLLPGLPGRPEPSKLSGLDLPTESLVGPWERPNQPVSVIAIEDTPAPPARDGHVRSNNPPSARSGFLEFSSDDLFSSPFPGTAPTQRRRLQDRLPAPGTRSPLQESIRENAANAAAQRHRATRAEYDADGYSDSIGQARPAKRLRLSPSIEGRAAPRPKLPTIGTGNRLPGHGRQVPPSPKAQQLSHFMDDFSDDLDDFPPVRRGEPTNNRPKADTECIDLLSSSDSEANLTGSTTVAATADSDFVDVDDLLMQPSPRPRGQLQQQPKEVEELVLGHRTQPSAEIMLLSSSPLTSNVRRPPTIPTRPASSKSRTAVDRPAQAQQRRQPMNRSLSEGHALAFFDGDDDDDDARVAEELLEEWRKTRQSVPQERYRSGTGRQAPPARRRSSFDGAAAGRQPKKTTNPSTALNDAEREARRKEKEETREENRKEKEAEKERRLKEREVEKERRKIASDIAKEKKAQERAEAAAFNSANRSRVDKAVAAPEMIVRLPTTLSQATKEVVETMLGEIKSNHETWTSSPVDNVVTWRRKVTAEYKPDLGHWVPVDARTEDEKHALVVLRGEDFVQLILASRDPDIRRQVGGHDLNSHVQAMKRAFADHKVIYLIEGLNAWKSKNRTIRNRQFVAAVRNADGGGEGSTSTPAAAAAAAALARSEQPQPPPPPQQQIRPSQRLGRRGQQQPPQHLDEALVDDALLDMQVEHGGDDGSNGGNGVLLVHETQSSLDTARWIKIFTEQIATAPYRQQREELYAAAASFCMDSGQIATGDNAAEMYTLMLQQIGRVTEPIALGVAAHFDSVPKLLRGFAEEGPLALEACLKSRNRNGALSDRTIGQALSRRLYKVFMGQDEASTDV